MDELHEIIRTVLKLDPTAELADNMQLHEIPGVDSLGWLTILLEVEKAFGISISSDDAADIETISDIRKLKVQDEV